MSKHIEDFRMDRDEFCDSLVELFKDFANKNHKIDSKFLIDNYSFYEMSRDLKEYVAQNINNFFKIKTLEEKLQHYTINKWIHTNHELSKLWKDVVVENAKVSDEPHITANEVVEEYKKKFNCE